MRTGPARFQINRHSFNLFDSVWLDLNQDGVFQSNEQIVTPNAGNGSFVEQGGTEYRSGATDPISATLEESGPLRTMVRVEGFHADATGAHLLRYVTRLTFYAGQSYVKVDQTLIEGRVAGNGNDWGIENQRQTTVDDAGLRLHVVLSGTPQVSIRGSQDAVYATAMGTGDTAEIVQHRMTNWQVPMSYEVQHDAATVETGRQATRAWLDISDGRWGLAVGTRDFWQKNPERLAARGDDNGAGGTVQVEFPAVPYTFYQAMGLGEEAIFYFHRAGTGTQGITGVLEGFSKDPLFAITPPAWMVASGAFGDVPASPAPAPFDQLDQVVQQNYDATMQFVHDGKSYGLLNYLDMPVDAGNVADDPNQTDWGNSYYDAPSAQIREFARSGDYRWVRDLAFPQIRHFYTTDMYDTDDPASYQNGISGAVGPYHREGWTGEYHYMESLWTYYYLTGDQRALERGVQAAQTYATNPMWAVDADYGFGPGLTTRINSQKFHTMLQGWLATGDASLKAALDTQMHDYLTHMFTHEGFVVERYSHDNPYTADQGWMVATLIHDTVYQYYLATDDALAREFVVTVPQRIAQYHRVSSDPNSPDYFRFYNEIEITPNGSGGFTTSPVFPNGNSDDYFYLGGKFGLATALARAGKVSGDATLLTEARDLLTAVFPQWEGGTWDKPAAQQSLRVMQGVAILTQGTAPANDNPPVLAPDSGLPARSDAKTIVVTVHNVAPTATASSTALVSGASGRGDRGANQAYVAALYVDVLGRPADPGGLDYWTGQLDRAATRGTVAGSMVHGDAYDGSSVITPAFQRFLGRTPDAGGLAYWTDQMQHHGLTDERLEAGLIGSAEFYPHAGGDDKLWVDAMYLDLLGRDPDPQGDSYWIGQLARGAPRWDVAYSIAAGPERERQRMTDDYMHYLGRLPDEQGLAYWLNQFARGVTNEDLIAGFVASDEYYQKQTASPPERP